ncbi:MAG TPA: DUF1214 domain-containing protein [Aestuariivirga sp.]|nr:DUF1214 domain-containing protein [Aestuariivirga sp.]
MSGIVNGSLAVAAGILAGLASAVAAIELYSATPVDSAGPWRSWDVSSSSKIRPYALDHYLMSGRFPPAAGQMREFSTHRTSDGSTLNGACDYLLVAKTAPALWWTLAAFSDDATPGSNAVITADTVIAENDGSIRLIVSHSPANGNWIRPSSAGNFTLLYTIAEPSSDFARAALPMFTVERVGC